MRIVKSIVSGVGLLVKEKAMFILNITIGSVLFIAIMAICFTGLFAKEKVVIPVNSNVRYQGYKGDAQ